MASFDFMTDVEFHKVFDRTSARVDLQGCGTAAEINQRLQRRINQQKEIYGAFGFYKAKNADSRLVGLVANGFGRRAIDDAMSYPRGKVALTLKYGRRRAELILNKKRFM